MGQRCFVFEEKMRGRELEARRAFSIVSALGPAMQHILVSAQDPRLAKKVRILLARDECDVEILDQPNRLEQRLRLGGVSLLVLSRELNGDDAIDMLARRGAG